MAASWAQHGGCPGAPSDTGAFRLSWTGGDNATYRVEQVDHGKSTLIYQGPDTATTITGQREGKVSYRVGVVDNGRVSAWSKTCTVRVQPPATWLAFTLFAVGALVTLCTIIAIVRGHRAHRAGEIG